MKKFSCVLAATILWVGMVFFEVSVCSAQDHLLADLLKCNRVVDAEGPRGYVATRLYPFGKIDIPLPSDSASLISTIGLYDLNALAAHRVSRLLIHPNTAATSETERQEQLREQEKPLNAQPYIPDTFVFSRGNEVTVFPRVLLEYASVSKCLIKQGDFIGTMVYSKLSLDREKPDKEQQELSEDPLRIFSVKLKNLSESNDREPSDASSQAPADSQQKAFTLRFGGSFFPSSVEIPFRRNVNNLSSLELEKDDRKILDAQLAGIGGAVHEMVPVYVLTRNAGQFKVRYICPLRDYGAFGTKGKILKRIAQPDIAAMVEGDEEKVILENNWNALFGLRIGGIPLNSGETIEVTLIETVLPFHQVALE